MKRSTTTLLITALSLFLLLPLAHVRAYAQAQGERTIRMKRQEVKIGATRKEVAAGSAEQMNLWAVLIGVSRFQYGDQDIAGNYISNLRFADADAQAVYDFLRSPEGGGFRDEREGGHMILLKDEEATKASVQNALGKLKQTRPNDFFIIFIAAHGMLAPDNDPVTKAPLERPYFVLHDTDPRDFKKTGLAMDEFRQLIREIPAKKGLVLSDTCHSAGVQLDGRGSSTPRVNARYIEEMKSIDAGVGFISSAGPFEAAKEPAYLEHGAFTYSLLEGLRGNADVDQDAKVTFKEIAEYVREEVPKITDSAQHPEARTDMLEANFLALSVVDYADLNPETGADQYGTLVIRTPDLDGVEVAIDDSYREKMDARTQRAVKVKAGPRRLSFTRGAIRQDIQATVEPRKSKYVEVNLTFSQGDEESLVEPTAKQLNVYLTEAKEPSKEARKLFQEGVESFNKQKFDAAVELLTRANQANGGAYPDALVYLGRAQQSLGLEKAAVASFKRALELRPSDYEAEALLAEAELKAGGNVADVIARLKDIIYRHPRYGFARVVYADALLLRQDYINAERQLKQAIDLEPKSPAARMIMAEVLTFQRSKVKCKQAVEEAQKALELYDAVSRKQVSPSRGLKRLSISHVIFGGGRYVNYSALAETQYILGYALVGLLRTDDTLTDRELYLGRARTSIDEAIRLAQKVSAKERLSLALDASAQIYVLQADPLRAIKDGEEALKLTTADDLKGEIHLTLSEAYKSDQKYAKASDHLKQYLALTGSLLSPKERSELEAELDLLNRKKVANKQK